jgi:hypothetical protein
MDEGDKTQEPRIGNAGEDVLKLEEDSMLSITHIHFEVPKEYSSDWGQKAEFKAQESNLGSKWTLWE